MSTQPAAARLDRRLLSRLQQDLAELRGSPYPGVAVFTDEADLRKLCLVLTPPSGPWKDLALHFDVHLPDAWPGLPPQVSATVRGIEHPNLFGSYICCDLLKTQEQIYAEAGYTGGYTPALTLRGLFLQFLTFFSNTSVEQDGGYVYYIGDHITTAYVWDDNKPMYQFPERSGCRHRDACACVQGFKAMEELWQNSAAPVVEVKSSIKDVSSHTKKTIQGRAMHRVEHVNRKWTSTLKLISSLKCKKCPYGSTLPHHNVVASKVAPNDIVVPKTLRQPPSVCALEKLSDDCLHEVASALPSEGLIALSSAYPRFRNIINSFHVLLRRELTCFFLRLPLNECILGIGVAMDSGARTLSSDFDWLSMEAFDNYKVRLSIEKRSFNYFLPLAFSRPNFLRALPEIRKRLYSIDVGLREAEAQIERRTRRPSNRRTGPPAKPYDTVEVIYRMMNAIVVSLMKSCDDTMSSPSASSGKSQTLLFASEKAVTSYCLLLHLLMCLCRSQPEILSDATVKLRRFVDIPKTRYKTSTPDLGELIVIITLVLLMPPTDKTKPITWEFIRGKFLEEVVTRNVRWVLNDSPELEVMEPGASDYRLNTTFKNSKTSLRLVMFQITFLDVFLQTYGGDIGRLDDNYGFAEKQIPEGMVKEIKEIYKVDNWPQFFVRVRLGKTLSREAFSQMLRDSVQESARRGYHRQSPQPKMEQLRKQRSEMARAEQNRG
ncbi:hypothetical protein CPB83DRAFT_861484 [Crepidotus variabilis]|uniref:UBC core domain-containing protein n=1 Tax=Crepidotus variabilis TaxID=179855 RepID=A0A9P6JL05_9AGAR|nr:hypothetical protein CPB83DRAFT_861484 [Crepidotus variabilis]